MTGGRGEGLSVEGVVRFLLSGGVGGGRTCEVVHDPGDILDARRESDGKVIHCKKPISLVSVRVLDETYSCTSCRIDLR